MILIKDFLTLRNFRLNIRSDRAVYSLFFFFVAVFSSWTVLERFTGYYGISLYAVISGLIIGFIPQYWQTIQKIKPRLVYLVPFFVIIILSSLFLILNPIANNKDYFGGSDSDDALNQAATALLEGKYPYNELTYLGNAITPMPGAVLIAVPFVAVFGNSGTQNLFWISVFLLFLFFHFNKKHLASALGGLLLLSLPLILYQLAIGSDHLANAIYVLLAFIMLDKYLGKNQSLLYVVAVLNVGIALSSRVNFTLLFPLFFFYGGYKYGWRRSLFTTGMSLLVFIIVTLPFYLYNPDGFAPLHTRYKLDRFNNVLPNAQLIVPAVSLLTGILVIVLKRKMILLNDFLLSSAIVLFIPVLSGVILRSLQESHPSLGYSSYSTFFIPFVIVLFLTKFLGRDAEYQSRHTL